ncbi:hypothetical protein PPL_04835 [Heterostelium album PN500]|uniref:Pesticidal crystal protein N-terminal domain-containing protein n=1 Tax=Heterostelium pallidum (strain ATCC 26659 / Pp 5 / PN500) TaxID=670386 RepID=D3B8P2_HETP5|nr:hypothetical protein PPL_04835 [Heterostelium album PN500]EFA82410.1 hypothetical protein PPL_04835 [Heterostelium album PN500]|eukprot:XP_020434527.1 hypothetical protein PPL_04835 [Heterostelium album PN500]
MSNLYPLDVNGIDYKYIARDFHLQPENLVKKYGTKGGVHFVAKILEHSKEDLEKAIRGEARTWEDNSRSIANFVTATACFVPVIGPAVSAFFDLIFGITFEFIKDDKKIKPQEAVEDKIKKALVEFFNGLTSGKVDDVKTALGQLEVKTANLAANKGSTQNIANFTSQYNILYAQISSLFNQIINQSAEMRTNTLSMFKEAVLIFMSRVMSLIGLRTRLGLTPEFVKDTLGLHVDITQFLYIKHLHAEYQNKLNAFDKTADIVGYFQTRNKILESVDGVWIDNPVVYYTVEYNPNTNNPYNPVIDILKQIRGDTRNLSYAGKLVKIVGGLNADGEVVNFKCVNDYQKSTSKFTLASGEEKSQKDLALVAGTVYSSVTVGMDSGKGSFQIGDLKMTGTEIFFTKKINMSYTEDELKEKRLVQVGLVRLSLLGGFYTLFSGIVDRLANSINVLYSSTATVIGPVKYSKESHTYTNFDDVFIGWNSVTINKGGFLEFNLDPIQNDITKYDVFARVTSGTYGPDLTPNFDVYLTRAKEKANNNSLKLLQFFKVVSGSNEKTEITVTKNQAATSEKYSVEETFRHKTIQIGSVNFNTPAKNTIKLANTGDYSFILEALIFRPILPAPQA